MLRRTKDGSSGPVAGNHIKIEPGQISSGADTSDENTQEYALTIGPAIAQQKLVNYWHEQSAEVEGLSLNLCDGSSDLRILLRQHDWCVHLEAKGECEILVV